MNYNQTFSNTMTLVTKYGDPSKLQQMRELFSDIVQDVDTKLVQESQKRSLSESEIDFLCKRNIRPVKKHEIDIYHPKTKIKTIHISTKTKIPTITLSNRNKVVELSDDDDDLTSFIIDHKMKHLRIIE